MRMYTVGELETISGLTRRTIGDYTAKGLLAGPSHRGRGARYSQSDVDALQVIPRLRTLMKKDFTTLRSVRGFMSLLSTHDLHKLSRQKSEQAFVLAVREIRVRMSVTTLLPQIPPERISAVISNLTPEQIRGVDSGRIQLGAVVDMADLLNGYADDPTDQFPVQELRASEPDASTEDEPSWTVNWLNGGSEHGATEKAGLSFSTEPFSSPDGSAPITDNNEAVTDERLAELNDRLERLEKLLVAQ